MTEKKEKDVTSLRVEKALWKEAKIYAIEQDTTLSELIERLLKEQIAKTKKSK